MKYSTVRREKSTSTKGHYVKNADLLPAVIEAKEAGVLTDKLVMMIQLIAERYSRKGNFVSYSFREDMVSAAVENLCKNWHKFNQDKYSNPFAFYTTAIHHSFLQYMADEKKHRNIRDALLIDAGSNPSFNFMQGEKDESSSEVSESDEHYVPPVKMEDSDENGAGSAAQQLMAESQPKKKTVRYEGREPGKVTRATGDSIIIDPITGEITFKTLTATEKRKQTEQFAAEAAAREEARPVVRRPFQKAAKKETE